MANNLQHVHDLSIKLEIWTYYI